MFRIPTLLFFLVLFVTGCTEIVINNSYITKGRKNFDEGVMQLKKENYQTAMEEFTRAIEYNDREPKYFVNLGNAQYQLKLFDKSRKSFFKAVQLDPKNKEGWYNLALAYQALGKKTEAIRAFRKYEALN